MAKATITNISDHRPPQQPQGEASEPQFPERIPDAKLASKLRDMESELCDLREMAGLAADYLEGAIGTRHTKLTKNEEFYWLPDLRRSRMSSRSFTCRTWSAKWSSGITRRCTARTDHPRRDRANLILGAGPDGHPSHLLRRRGACPAPTVRFMATVGDVF